MVDEIAVAAHGQTDHIHPVRWALLAIVLLLLSTMVSVLPVVSLRSSEQYTNHQACHQRADQWSTLDRIIRKVDAVSPGTRAEYEPLLGPKPKC